MYNTTVYHVKTLLRPLLMTRCLAGISLKLKPETAVIRPCDSGIAFDHTAFFAVGNCQLKLLSDI